MNLQTFVYGLTPPFVIAFIGAALIISFVLWRVMLKTEFAEIGFRPLAFAYFWATTGLVGFNFCKSYWEFSEVVASGHLQELDRWLFVPRWTFDLTSFALFFVLPILGLACVPGAAACLKRGVLTLKNIAGYSLAIWLILAILSWTLSGNEWYRTHAFESFMIVFRRLFPGMLVIVLPFMLAIHRATRLYRLRRDSNFGFR